MLPKTARLALLAALAAAAPLRADEPEGDATAEEMIAQAKAVYGIGDPDQACADAPPADGEILVCARRKAPPPRLEPTERTDTRPDMKAAALETSRVGRAPGGGVTMRICFLQRCPRALYFIDLSSLPEPAPGTDADRISKGEMRAR